MEAVLKCHDTTELQLLGCSNCVFPVFESILVILKMRLYHKFLRFVKITFSRIAKILVVFQQQKFNNYIINKNKTRQILSLIPASLLEQRQMGLIFLSLIYCRWESIESENHQDWKRLLRSCSPIVHPALPHNI